MVDQAIRTALKGHGETITGLSNLADGADQIFARAVLDAGGTIEAFIAASDYRTGSPAQRTQNTTNCWPAPPPCTNSRSANRRQSPTWPPASS